MKFEKGKFRLGVSGNFLHAHFYPGNTYGSLGGKFEKGNQLAKAENLTPKANANRFRGLTRKWAANIRLGRGHKFVTVKEKKQLSKARKRKIHQKLIRELVEIRDMARMSATAAMERMVDIVENVGSRDSDAISAASLILDRAYGKASQTTINANVDANGKQNEVSSKELDTRIAKALDRVESIAGRAPKAPASPKQPVDLRKLN